MTFAAIGIGNLHWQTAKSTINTFISINLPESSRAGSTMHGLSNLPYDLIELIVSYIDADKDLIRLAMTNRAFYKTIIPNHSQYRLIRGSTKDRQVWSHLASRPDLTRNIRILHIENGDVQEVKDRLPVNLVSKLAFGPRRSKGPMMLPNGNDPSLGNVNKETSSCQELCYAMKHMQQVREATWTALSLKAKPVENHENEEMVLDAIISLPSLVKLSVVGNFGSHLRQQAEFSKTYPLWRASNLTNLHLRGGYMHNPSNFSCIQDMISRSPNLENLTVPNDCPWLPHCILPQLRRLILLMDSIPESDEPCITFLHRHPWIEDLSWIPSATTKLPHASLPSLKRLAANRSFTSFVLGDHINPPRPLEVIEGMSLVGTESIHNLRCLDGNKITKLKIGSYDGIQSIQSLAEMFPNLTWLHVPENGAMKPTVRGVEPTHYDLNQWIQTLSLFHRLEVFHEVLLLIRMLDHVMDRAIQKIALACPQLRELMHWNGVRQHISISRSFTSRGELKIHWKTVSI